MITQFLLAALCSSLAAWVLWVFFLAVMSLQTARDRGTLTTWGRRLGKTVLAFGYFIDLVIQMTLAVVVFGEPPRELTVSARIARLIATGSGWRKARAEWWRDHLLKPFDPTGRHG